MPERVAKVTRAERHRQVRALRDRGLLLREIAAELGLAVQTVHDVLSDPDGSKARERKRRLYSRPCDGCGATLAIGGRREAEARGGLCVECVREFRGTPEGRREQSARTRGRVEWSDAAIFAAIRNVAVDGRATCAMYDEEYARAGGEMPSRCRVIQRFGTWAKAVRAAGLEPVAEYGPRIDRWTEAACRGALARCAAELGRSPLAVEYDRWARRQEDAPSLTTVRMRLDFVEEALAAAPVELARAA